MIERLNTDRLSMIKSKQITNITINAKGSISNQIIVCVLICKENNIKKHDYVSETHVN